MRPSQLEDGDEPMNTKSPLWRILFLAEHYGRMTLTLDEIAKQIGIAPGTIRNRRTRGEFQWLRSDGRTLRADVADVAAYLDEAWREGTAVARDAAAADAVGGRRRQ